MLSDRQAPSASPANACEKLTSRLIGFLLFMQASGYTLFDIFFSIQRSKNKKILDWIDPDKNVWWIAGIYFLLTNAENVSIANSSSQQFCEIIRTGDLPHHWPKLSNRGKYTTVSLSITLTALIAATECISFSYATEELGFSAELSYTLGTLAAFASLTSWPQICELLFELFASQHKPYHNKASEWVCKLIGFPLAFLSTAQIITDCYFPIVDEFNIEKNTVKWGVFALSTLSAANYLATYSKMGIAAIDDFIGKISAGCCPAAEEVFSFLTSVFGSAILADLSRARILSFLLSPEIALPFTLYDFMIDLLAWCSALYGGNISAYNAYPYILQCTQIVVTRTSHLLNTCIEYCYPPSADPPATYQSFSDEKPAKPPPQPTKPLSQNPHLFFSPPLSVNTEILAEEKPRESCCSKIMKWFGYR